MKEFTNEQGLVVLLLIAVFMTLGIFAGENNSDCPAPSNDQNNDGEVTREDLSIAFSRFDNIMIELRNQDVPANVLEDVYPDRPPYSPSN